MILGSVPWSAVRIHGSVDVLEDGIVEFSDAEAVFMYDTAELHNRGHVAFSCVSAFGKYDWFGDGEVLAPYLANHPGATMRFQAQRPPLVLNLTLQDPSWNTRELSLQEMQDVPFLFHNRRGATVLFYGEANLTGSQCSSVLPMP